MLKSSFDKQERFPLVGDEDRAADLPRTFKYLMGQFANSLSTIEFLFISHSKTLLFLLL